MARARSVPTRSALLLAAALGASAVAPATAAPPPGTPSGSCEVVALDVPDGTVRGWVLDLTDDGRYFGAVAGSDDVPHPVYWSSLDAEAELVETGLLDGVAFDITEDGTLLGDGTTASGEIVPWVRQADGTVDVLPPAYVRRLNEQGRAAGSTTRNRKETATRWASLPGPSTRLTSPGEVSYATGINEAGWTSGLVVRGEASGRDWFRQARPVLWTPQGRVVELERAGLDGHARMVDEQRRSSGWTWWGWSTTGHSEPAVWDAAGRVSALGVLDQGTDGDAFGRSDGGWVVGRQSRLTDEHGWRDHGFLWQESYGSSQVRLLPSVAAGADADPASWPTWQSWSPHGVSDVLRQVAGESDDGGTAVLDSGEVVSTTVPTVWRDADRCGVLVPTTHATPHDASWSLLPCGLERKELGERRDWGCGRKS